jgi:hypothetical protein
VPTEVHDTVKTIDCPESRMTPEGDTVTLVPVRAGLTVPDALAHALAGGLPGLLSVTLTEYARVEVSGPVDRD